MKKIIAATLIAAASLSASAQTQVVLKDFQVNESRSGSFYYVDYVAKRNFDLKEQTKAMVVVLKDACGREDSKHGSFPTVNAVFGKTVLPVAVNAESCGK